MSVIIVANSIRLSGVYLTKCIGKFSSIYHSTILNYIDLHDYNDSSNKTSYREVSIKNYSQVNKGTYLPSFEKKL